MKKMKKYAIDMTKYGVVAGVGTKVIADTGGPTGGMTNLSSFVPTAGTLMGAGTAIRMVKKMGKKRRKKKKRRRR